MRKAIRHVLIANRGEIAVRIIRTCRDLGISTTAVFSDPDRDALHVHLADRAYPLGGSTAAETYLNAKKILAVARRSSADAVHPGYGFLSENAGFAQAVADAGLNFIGPTAKAIQILGDKTAAREIAQRAAVPILPGSVSSFTDVESALTSARKTGFPLLLKAAAGGGGKGMRVVRNASEFSPAFAMAMSEAESAFGDRHVYVERYLDSPHHVEIQILRDHHGNAVFLGERDCSIQRRHQKIIEESPSPLVDEELRNTMGQVALRLVSAAGYTNAGTVEFLIDSDRRFYFLEVNTRLQVEHPVTEAVTGLDLVKEQISIAAGEELSVEQSEIVLDGHAIECRVYAEDPSEGFLPSTGVIRTLEVPSGPHIRVDVGARAGDSIGIHYDPMLAKVITHRPTRPEAISSVTRALEEFVVTGVDTTIPFCRFVVNHDVFREGRHTTQLINEQFIAEYLNQTVAPHLVQAGFAAAAYFAGDTVERKNHKTVAARKWRQRRLDTFQ